MKKVMLSLVAFALFNTINAEEIENINEVLDNKEVTTIVEESTNNVVLAESNDEVKTYVAEINDTKYETLDEAINNATSEDVIKLLDNVTITVGTISKKVTINGNGFKITVPRQNNTEHGYLAIRGNVTLNNTKIYFTREAKNKSDWSLYMAPSSIFNLNNSECTFENIGIYADAVATINLNNSKMTLSNMKYTSMMSDNISKLNIKNNSEFKISKPMDINGITGFDILVDNSSLDIEDCVSQGMVYGSLTLNNNAKASFINCGVGINLYAGNNIMVDGNSELTIKRSSERAIMSQSGKSGLTIKKGSKLTVSENGYGWNKSDDESIHYASKGAITMGVYGWHEEKSKLYIYKRNSFINFEDGAIVNITNNYVRGITFSGETAYIGNTTNITNNGGERVAVGGGIYNIYGNITISKDAKIYNNHANTSSDDIYNSGNKATITFEKTGEDWILDDCEDKIDGWYDDNKTNRWNAHDKENKYVEEVNSNKYEKELTLKAAHGIYGKLIVRYVDNKGNILSEELTSSEKVDTEYTTTEKEFEDYSLIDVQGETKGKYIDGTIIVTYIYEFTSGMGGDDVPATGITSSASLEVTTIISLITLISTIIIRKRFN